MDDLAIARAYVQKADRAKSKGLEFALPFTSFKNVMNAKRCRYSGIELTVRQGRRAPRATDVTIDRIDNTRGYIPGNVVACCRTVNEFKGNLENPNNFLTTGVIKKIIKRLEGALDKTP